VHLNFAHPARAWDITEPTRQRTLRYPLIDGSIDIPRKADFPRDREANAGEKRLLRLHFPEDRVNGRTG
jgi:hypothetical protein